MREASAGSEAEGLLALRPEQPLGLGAMASGVSLTLSAPPPQPSGRGERDRAVAPWWEVGLSRGKKLVGRRFGRGGVAEAFGGFPPGS